MNGENAGSTMSEQISNDLGGRAEGPANTGQQQGQENRSQLTAGGSNSGGTEDPTDLKNQHGQRKELQLIDSHKIDQILEVVSFLKNKTTDTEKLVYDKCGALAKTQTDLLEKFSDNTSKIESNKLETVATSSKVSDLLDRLLEYEQEMEQVN